MSNEFVWSCNNIYDLVSWSNYWSS
uniref:Uncharacterized protein n=1 Tax=Arundo donax TaxID=35708 RepID=A0A0A9CYV6_ARUDO